MFYDSGQSVDVCGPVGEEPEVHRGVEATQIGRICETAFEKPDRHAAQRFLREILDQVDDELVGLRNQGLLSTHELKVGVPERDDWSSAIEETEGLLEEDGQDLVEELGYEVERLTDQSYLLKDVSEGRETAVAVFLEGGESFDHAQDRFTGRSPVSYALNEADKKNLDYVIANSENTLRLYTTNPDAGFGSRGRTDTFVEVNTDLLTDENAAYLWLLFSSQALRDEGALHEIMESSKDYAADLGRRLRERIYDDVIPDLAEAIAEARDLDNPGQLNGVLIGGLQSTHRAVGVRSAVTASTVITATVFGFCRSGASGRCLWSVGAADRPRFPTGSVFHGPSNFGPIVVDAHLERPIGVYRNLQLRPVSDSRWTCTLSPVATSTSVGLYRPQHVTVRTDGLQRSPGEISSGSLKPDRVADVQHVQVALTS